MPFIFSVHYCVPECVSSLNSCVCKYFAWFSEAHTRIPSQSPTCRLIQLSIYHT